MKWFKVEGIEIITGRKLGKMNDAKWGMWLKVMSWASINSPAGQIPVNSLHFSRRKLEVLRQTFCKSDGFFKIKDDVLYVVDWPKFQSEYEVKKNRKAQKSGEYPVNVRNMSLVEREREVEGEYIPPTPSKLVSDEEALAYATNGIDTNETKYSVPRGTYMPELNLITTVHSLWRKHNLRPCTLSQITEGLILHGAGMDVKALDDHLKCYAAKEINDSFTGHNPKTLIGQKLYLEYKTVRRRTATDIRNDARMDNLKKRIVKIKLNIADGAAVRAIHERDGTYIEPLKINADGVVFGSVMMAETNKQAGYDELFDTPTKTIGWRFQNA